MKNNKVIARVFGGLGNQLFIYAAARRLAIENNADLILDNVSGFKRDFEYNRHYQLVHFNIAGRVASKTERLEPFSRIRRYLKRNTNKYLPANMRTYISEAVNQDASQLISLKVEKDIHLEGYWQSEDYFYDIKDTLQDELTILSPIDEISLSMLSEMHPVKAVALHIRFFESPDLALKDESFIQYYDEAVKLMESMVENCHYYIFSTDLSSARRLINLPDSRITLVDQNNGDENAYRDFWLMLQCDHFILANSTFSWWPAWLSNNEDKVVIAQKKNINTTDALSLSDRFFPDSWNLI